MLLESFRILVCACSLIAITSTPLTARTFTNTAGKSINAEIISVDNDKVTLKLLNSKNNYTVKISTLSEKDQNYILKWNKKKKAKEKNKPAKTSPTTYREFSYKTLKEKYKLSDNFDKEWPTLSKAGIPDIKIIEENDENSRYVYHSDNYEFICDVKLSKNVVNKFAHLFEATKQYCKDLPISLLKAQIPDGQSKYKILLFETQVAYVKNGGIPGSAGVYTTRGDVIMVPLTSLGVIKSGSGYRYDYNGSNNTLPHEITHQLTNLEYFSHGARGWFSEGLAEYVAMTDYRSGKFMARGNLKDIKDSVTGFSKKTNRGRNIGEKFTAPDLKKFMTQTYPQFTSNGNFNYGFGALMTYYFLHLEDDRTNINSFLSALNDGKQGEEALKALLNGRSFGELEKDIAKAWKSKGVDITFK